MRGSEGFSGQVCNTFPELVITRSDKAAPIAVKGVTNVKFGVAAVTIFEEIWGI